ncbi:16047_t:CDS:1, partial [Dentiscutata erythropus]
EVENNDIHYPEIVNNFALKLDEFVMVNNFAPKLDEVVNHLAPKL